MRAKTLGLVFGIVFCVTVIVSAPASLLVAALPGSVQGFYYSGLSGTVWSAELTGVRIEGVDAGTVTVKTAPLSFLVGRFSVSWRLNGRDVTGTGAAATSFFGPLRFSAEQMTLDAGAALPWLPVKGKVSAESLTVSGDLDRGCSAAAGRLETDVLVRSAMSLGWRGPPMAGSITCDEGALLMTLDGRDETSDVTFEATVRPDGTFDQRVLFTSSEPQVRAALNGFGFVAFDGRQRLDVTGRWR